jgi:cation/acetate symporter
VKGNLAVSRRPGLVQELGEDRPSGFEDKNGDGRIQYYNDKNPEFAGQGRSAFGWKGNELTKFDRDIMVLANPEIAGLPNWVIALSRRRSRGGAVHRGRSVARDLLGDLA